MIANYVFLICAISTAFVLCRATDFSTGFNKFASRLYQVLPQEKTNLVFSPISLHAALSLAYQGAGEGTARAFQRSLQVTGINETALEYREIMSALNTATKVNVKIANKIYVKSDYRLKENFNRVARNYFSADAEPIDFLNQPQTADEINKWVNVKTNGKIDKLVGPLDFSVETRALLLNAIYFKGNWYSKFYPEDTTPARWYTSDTESVDCNLMHQMNDFEYGEDVGLDAKVLKMKYEDQRFAMVIVLPNSVSGLAELEKRIIHKDISTIATRKQRVDVLLPKFKFESKLNLKGPLSQIGLAEIFTSQADFSNLLDTTENIRVSQVVQKAVIEVNEEGSEAAAATAVYFIFRSLPPQGKSFQADHPFMFYITAELGEPHATSTILFMGKVISPS